MRLSGDTEDGPLPVNAARLLILPLEFDPVLIPVTAGRMVTGAAGARRTLRMNGSSWSFGSAGAAIYPDAITLAATELNPRPAGPK